MITPARVPFTVLAAALSLGQQPSTVPEVAHQLPRTVPPAAWPAGSKPVDASSPTGKDAAKAPQAAAPAEQDKWVTVFPHVRVNRAQKAVEFDGKVPWDFHNPDTPRTELELLVCLPMRDKEHESLVMSEAKGADVHAALLMVGFEPGSPGRLEFGEGKDDKLKRIAPVGPIVSVSFRYLKDGTEHADDPRSWVTDEHATPRERLEETDDVDLFSRCPTFSMVFGGSKVGQKRNEQGSKVNVYGADELGTLIGLCTFGSETIGTTTVVSPDSGVDGPRYIANNKVIPAADTPVQVRIEPDRILADFRPNDQKSAPGSNKTPALAPQQAPMARP